MQFLYFTEVCHPIGTPVNFRPPFLGDVGVQENALSKLGHGDGMGWSSP